MKWRLPPRFKVLQALGVICNKQICWLSANSATVEDKNVFFEPSTNAIYCEDLESERGYLSHHALAVLMSKGVLPFDKELCKCLQDIEWEKYNYSNYGIGEREIKSVLESRGVKSCDVDSYIEKVMRRITQNGFEVLESNKKQSSLLGYR
jgi:hypothetical protein